MISVVEENWKQPAKRLSIKQTAFLGRANHGFCIQIERLLPRLSLGAAVFDHQPGSGQAGVCRCDSLYRHRFGKISGLVNIGAFEYSDVVRQQLQRNGVNDR